MITLTYSHATAWLIAFTAMANLVLGIYHLLIVLETIRDAQRTPLIPAISLGLAYVGPPALIVITFARLAGII